MDSVHDEQNMTSVGLLHSDIPGSKLDCSSPRLFAAYHVLHRLSMPRHPSCALSSLTTRKIKISLCSQLSFFFCGNFFKTLLFFDCQSTPRIHRGSMKTSLEVSSTSCRFELVGVLGFEPRTSSLSGTRSNQLSYTPDIPLKMALPSATGLGSPFGNRHFLGAPLSVSPCGGLAAVLPTSSKVLFTDSTRDLKSNDFDQALLPFRSRQLQQLSAARQRARRVISRRHVCRWWS